MSGIGDFFKGLTGAVSPTMGGMESLMSKSGSNIGANLRGAILPGLLASQANQDGEQSMLAKLLFSQMFNQGANSPGQTRQPIFSVEGSGLRTPQGRA